MKTPVICSNDYTLYLELYNNNLFIHCDCFKWSKTIRNNLIKDLDTFIGILRKPVYAVHEIEDKKHLKFLHLTKFQYFQDFIGDDNKTRQLFVRNPNGN